MRIARIGVALASGLLAAELTLAQEPTATLLHQDSGGLLELEGERILRIRGIAGTLSLREGKPGELRYEARTRDNLRQPKKLALWLDGPALLLTTVEGQPGSETLVDIAVPPELGVVLETSDSLVQASALGGRLAIVGSGLDVAARGLKGEISLDLAGGKALVSGTVERLDLAGSKVEARIEYATGDVSIGVEDSQITITASSGPIEGEVVRSRFDGEALAGALRLTAAESEVSLTQCSGGAFLELTASPIELSQSKGEFEVNTDADVKFSAHEGSLKVASYGGIVHGTGGNCTVEIEADGGQVRLEQLVGTTTVRGREVDLQLWYPKGEVVVETSATKVLVKKAAAPVRITNEYGDVEVEESTEAVRVSVRDGNVRLHGMKTLVVVESERGDVDVGWVSFSAKEDCTITSGGDARVRLPASSNVRVEAHAPDGLVESDLPGITVDDEGRSAVGTLGGSRVAAQQRPAIRIRAGGDVHLGPPGHE
jgi:DUF4097 and DUF4098 domain-containing protein YvlB